MEITLKEILDVLKSKEKDAEEELKKIRTSIFDIEYEETELKRKKRRKKR